MGLGLRFFVFDNVNPKHIKEVWGTLQAPRHHHGTSGNIWKDISAQKDGGTVELMLRHGPTKSYDPEIDDADPVAYLDPELRKARIKFLPSFFLRPSVPSG